MTELLNEAFAKAAELGQDEQDALARWILGELQNERRWDELLSATSDSLATLGDEALAEHRRGDSEPLDPSRL